MYFLYGGLQHKYRYKPIFPPWFRVFIYSYTAASMNYTSMHPFHFIHDMDSTYILTGVCI